MLREGFKEHCRYMKPDGVPCGVTYGLSSANGMCWFHDPEREKERNQARSQGGRVAAARRKRLARAEDLPARGLESAEDARVWASWIVTATAQGQIDNDTAQKLSTAVRTFLAAVDAADTEKKLKELQRQVEDLKKKGGNR